MVTIYYSIHLKQLKTPNRKKKPPSNISGTLGVGVLWFLEQARAKKATKTKKVK
jgi:hypothetical protein